MDKKKVLLFSRNSEYVKVLTERISTELDAEVFISDSKESLAEVVPRRQPDAILVDIPSISAGDAFEALKGVRAFRHDNDDIQCRIREVAFFILADKGEHCRSLFEEEKVSAYFEKPYDPNQLKSELRHVLGL